MVSAEPKNETEDVQSKINFYLYTKTIRDTPKLIDMANYSAISIDESFNRAKQTKVIIHGWLSHLEKPMIQVIKDAFMDMTDYNVIG